MKAREFLVGKGMDFEMRNILREPPTASELKAFAKRVGGLSELVAPTRKGEVEGMTDSQMLSYLAEDPKRLKRPIIDTGDRVFVGFSKTVRDALS